MLREIGILAHHSKTMSNSLLLGLKVLLFGLVVFFGYQLVSDLRGPIVFTNESVVRDNVVHEKLELIAEAQDAYYRIKGHYADNFDSLLLVCLSDSFTITNESLVRRSEYDEAVHGPNPLERPGDTVYYRLMTKSQVAIKDSLFHDLPYDVQNIRKVPYSSAEFYMATDEIDAAGGRYQVPTVEVTCLQKHYYAGLNKKFYDPADGYQFGSLYEANTDVYPARGLNQPYYPDEDEK